MASNPVFDRIDKQSRAGYAGFGRADARTQQATAGTAATDGLSSQQLQDLYNRPAAGPVQTKRLTIDDVVMKTAGLFAIVLLGSCPRPPSGRSWCSAASPPPWCSGS